jgi:thioredoxin reductase (NADPH)
MHDIIIIGAGPAGLTAGIYGSRFMLSTLLIAEIAGGQAASADLVENYPGFPEGISGPELTEKMFKQARRFGTEIVHERVIELKNASSHPKIVKTETKEYEAMAIIVATGGEPQKLKIAGEERLLGKGVSYCVSCDGPLFRDKEVIVIGGGDKAVSGALFLSQLAKKVILVHRREGLRAAKILEERALANKKIEFIRSAVATEVIGSKTVERVKIKNMRAGEEKYISAQGIFILIGTSPDTNFLRKTIACNKDGYIITGEDLMTSESGVYACGDCREGSLHQIVAAAAEGAIAASSAYKYIESLNSSGGSTVREIQS